MPMPKANGKAGRRRQNIYIRGREEGRREVFNALCEECKHYHKAEQGIVDVLDFCSLNSAIEPTYSTCPIIKQLKG